EQVLINLLKNAREAGGDPEAIALRISAVSTGATYIQVMDRGCGMSEEAMNKALLPFYSTKKDGTGLGLPLCREIIEAHQGTMSIERRSGGGTIVTCMLPAAPPLLGGTPPSTPK
ncbi:MAG: ATP-binding protein, partial [Myxococcota bacterium]